MDKICHINPDFSIERVQITEIMVSKSKKTGTNNYGEVDYLT